MNRLSKALHSERAAALFAALIVSALVLGTRALGWLEPIELIVYDRLLALRPEQPDAGADIIVVGYAEPDIMEMDQYPIPDDVMTLLLSRILAWGPRSVGVDFHRDVLIPPGSEKFEALMQDLAVFWCILRRKQHR